MEKLTYEAYLAPLINWLEEHRDHEAVELGAPASEKEIAAFEQETGFELPLVLKLLYRHFNGMRLSFSPYDLFPEIEEWACEYEIDGSEGDLEFYAGNPAELSPDELRSLFDGHQIPLYTDDGVEIYLIDELLAFPQEIVVKSLEGKDEFLDWPSHLSLEKSLFERNLCLEQSQSASFRLENVYDAATKQLIDLEVDFQPGWFPLFHHSETQYMVLNLQRDYTEDIPEYARKYMPGYLDVLLLSKTSDAGTLDKYGRFPLFFNVWREFVCP